MMVVVVDGHDECFSVKQIYPSRHISRIPLHSCLFAVIIGLRPLDLLQLPCPLGLYRSIHHSLHLHSFSASTAAELETCPNEEGWTACCVGSREICSTMAWDATVMVAFECPCIVLRLALQSSMRGGRSSRRGTVDFSGRIAELYRRMTIFPPLPT